MSLRVKLFALLIAAVLLSIGLIGTAQNDDEKSATSILKEGKKQMIFADFEEARTKFKSVYQMYPATSAAQEAVYLAGLAAFYDNEIEDAVEICVDGRNKYPQSIWNSKYTFLLASSYFKLNRTEDSAKYLLDKAVERSGDLYLLKIADYYLSIANAAYEGEVPESDDPYASKEKKKDYNKALRYFQKARNVKVSDEQKFDITNKMAFCNFELSKFYQAINEYNTIIETAEPDEEQAEYISKVDKENATKYLAPALFYRGESYLKLYDWKKSREDLKRIVNEYKKTEYNPLALISLAKSYIFEASSTQNKDAYDKAWGYYDLFFADFMKHEKAPVFLMECANTANSYGFNERAIKYWNKMLQSFHKDPEAGKASYMIGETYYNMKRFDECREQFKTFLASFPAHPNWNSAQTLLIQSYYNEFSTYYQEGMKIYSKYCSLDYRNLLEVNDDTPVAPAEVLANLYTNWENAKSTGEFFLKTYPVHGYASYVDNMLATLSFAEAVLNEYYTKIDAIQSKKEIRDADKKSIQKKYFDTLEVLRNLASKYSKNNVGAEAQFHAAEILEYQIGDLAEAIKEYEKVINNFQYTDWYYKARQAIQVMKKKEILVFSKRMFSTNEKAALNVTTRNIKKLKFKAYRLNLKSYYERHRSISNIEKVAVEIISPTEKWETPVPNYVDYRKDNETYNLPMKEAGAYILEVQADVYFARVLVIISDIGIVVKQSPKQLFVFAKDKVSGKPAPNVEILYFNGDKIESAGKTNEKGILNKKFVEQQNNLKVFAFRDKNYAFTDSYAGYAVATGYTAKGYIFADRSAYRPGDTVKFKGILRDVENGSYKSPSNKKVNVTVKNPKGITYFSEEKTTTEFGSVDGSFSLTNHAGLGTYTITIDYGTLTFSGSFKVEEYKKPDFMVNVTPEKNVYLTREEVNCKVNVKYFSDQPVQNSKLEWQLFSVPYNFDKTQFSEFAWFFQKTAKGKEKTSGMNFITSGNATCDENGIADIKFTGNKDRAERYVLQVSAQDINRRWASGSASVIMAEQEFYALLKSNRNLYRKDDNVVANLFTVAPNNSPVSHTGEIKVLKVDYKRGREVTMEIKTIKAETLDDGKLDINLKLTGFLAAPGHYRLHYIAYDRRETPISADIDYFVLGEMSDLSLKTRIVSDKQIYFEGETANFLLNSPTADTYALITFEGEEVLDYDIVKLTSNATEYKVAMKSLYSPNVFVKLTLSTNHQWFQDEAEVLVFRYLNVDIKANKKYYSPGEKAEYEVITTDQNGNPVKAELSVGVVDESIFSIFPDLTPDIKPFFYDKKRENAVNTYASYDWYYIGLTQLLPQAMMEEIERRKYESNNKNEELDDEDGWASDDAPNSAAEPAEENRSAGRRSATTKFFEKGTADKEMKKLDRMADELREEAEESSKDFKAKRPANKPQSPYPNTGDLQLKLGNVGGGGGAGGDVRQQQFIEPVIRKEFKDTAAFIPFVTTDETGKAKFSIELPDNLTTWRATARGITFETLVGEAQTKLTVTKGVLAKLDTPRFLNNGDTCAITGSVQNNLDEELEIKTEFVAEGSVTTQGASSSSMKIPAGKAEIVDYLLKADTAGASLLTFKAKSTVESDAEQRPLTINAFGKYNQFATSGNIVENSRSFNFKYPSEVVQGSVDAEFMLTPGHLNVMLDAMNGMLQNYGDNTARIVTQLYSACLTYRSMEKVGSIDAARRKALRKFIEYTLLELYDAQNHDGSFGWYIPKSGRYVPFSSWITAYALMSMEIAEDWGIKVDGTAKSNTINAVYRFLRSNTSDNDRAILGYAYSLVYSDGALQYLTPIFRRAQNLDNIGTAALALALKQAGDAKDAWDLVQTLIKNANHEGDVAYWQGAGIYVRNQDDYKYHYSVYDSVTATSWAFAAISAVQPNNELTKPALNWLLNHRLGRHWGTTKATADVVYALSKYIDAQKDFMANQMTVTLKVNNKEVKKLEINKSGEELGEKAIRIPAEFFVGGENTLTIEREGTGDLNFAFLLKYYEPADKVYARGNLIDVDRYYFKYEGENASKGHVKPGYSIIQTKYAPKYEPSQINKIISGEEIQVELRVHTRSNVENLVVEDYLPAGCEVSSNGRNNSWQYMERRDNRVIFYFNARNHSTDTVIRYALRAINPGVFRSMPTIARSYYQPEIYGHSNSNSLSIFDENSWKEPPEIKQITPDERYALIVKLYKKESWKDLVDTVNTLFGNWEKGDKLRKDIFEACLYYQMKGFYNLKDYERTADNYNIILGSNPQFRFTLDDRRDVAISYNKIGDDNNCSILSAAIIHDVLQIAYNVGEEYRALGEDLKAQKYLLDLWRAYPDYSATTQLYYNVANYFASIDIETEGESEYQFYKGDGVNTYVAEAYYALKDFCSYYPNNELTDDAMYNCMRYAEKLKDSNNALQTGQVFVSRFGFDNEGESKESQYLDDVLLSMTENYYKLNNWDMVNETAMKLVTRKFKEHSTRVMNDGKTVLIPGESPYKKNAQLYIAKVNHALGKVEEALKYYQMVADKFEDAKAAIEYFTASYLETPDSVESSPTEDSKLMLKHKNLNKIHCAAYKIDLLILFSLHKSLGNIRNIELTGIDPTSEFDIELKKTEPYREMKEEVDIPLKDAGVYLLIFTADHNIHKTTVLIKSELEMRIQRTNDNVRVYLTKRGTNVPVADAYVKVALNGYFIGSGNTDSRGIFEVSYRNANRGSLGVVAQKDEDFAFMQD